ncbi:uncharacterized protein PRCAT00004605001 [Priceomyces carsonii]|uniref:uncharacterized protein n=1 Tax=Priceomyces carsonii TaxID=28549 RepID=UPI002EDBAA76|nr:unnamed protein product [Priceomyces carsonii]
MISSSNNYESAAKDIEQEKRMVKALKRLSIGQMMNYDPDLPGDEMGFIHNEMLNSNTQDEDSLSEKSDASKKIKSRSPSPSLKRTSSLSRRFSLGKELDSNSILLDDADSDIFFDAEDKNQFYDASDPLLWVPANAHPEVDPEQFRIHVKVMVDELMEKRVSRQSSLKRKSSLSRVSLLSDKSPERASKSSSADRQRDEDEDSLFQDQLNRLSNPSLLELSNELEQLSKLAGMDATDTVTLARTLSTASLGYTDVEKQAIGELTSPPHTSPNRSPPKEEPIQASEPISPIPKKLLSVRTAGSGQMSSLTSDFALKRSRRIDYRKKALSPDSSSQTIKQDRFVELRQNLKSDPSLASLPIQMKKQHSRQRQSNPKYEHQPHSLQYPPQNVNHHRRQKNQYTALQQSPVPQLHGYYQLNQIPRRSSNQHKPKARDSQALFNCKNSDVMQTTSYTSRNDSPYQGIASSNVPLGYGLSKRGHQNKKIPSFASEPEQDLMQQKLRSRSHQMRMLPRQAPPGHPQVMKSEFRPSLQQQPVSYKKIHPQAVEKNHHRRVQRGLPKVPGRPSSKASPKALQQFHGQQPEISSISNPKEVGVPNGTTSKLNQNLDLLRSEINEFKESLVKVDSSTEQVNEEKVKSPSPEEQSTVNFSFDSSLQDISYEDSLGIEKEVLKELEADKDDFPRKKLFFDETDTHSDDLSTLVSYQSGDKGQVRKQNSELSVALDDRAENFLTLNEGDDRLAINAREEGVDMKLKGSLLNSFEKNKDTSSGAFNDREDASELVKKHSIDLNVLVPERRDIVTSNKPLPKLKSADDSAFTSDESSLDSSPKKEKVMKSFGNLPNHSSSSLSSEEPFTGTRKLKKKTSWQWLKERSSSFSSTETAHGSHLAKNQNVPFRSLSTPEITSNYEDEAKKNKSTEPSGKENVITKLFKKKKSQPRPLLPTEGSFKELPGVTVDYESDTEGKKPTKRKGLFKKNKAGAIEKQTLENKEHKNKKSSQVALKTAFSKSRDSFSIDDHSSSIDEEDLNEDIINLAPEDVSKNETFEPKEMQKVDTETTNSPEVEDTKLFEENENAEEKDIIVEKEEPRSTIDIQEQIKKSIKRTSKANQPLTFTDSAFGFPLPPPSQSTLVMLDYRFPVHVERAIYRLSHLKLANPKRSLREQVLLSNFMYAYLNLVDHTLHLEQHMNNEGNQGPNETGIPILNDNNELLEAK